MNEEFIIPEKPEYPFEQIEISIFKDEIIQHLTDCFEKVNK